MALQVWLPLNGNLNNQGLSNLTFSGSPTFESGKLGQSARFGSLSNKLISSSKVTLGNQVSISFWIKIVSWKDWGRVFNLYTDDNLNGFHSCLYTSSKGSIGTQLYVNDENIHDGYSGNLSDLNWHHFALVVDGNIKKHYFDGKLINSWTMSSSMPSNTDYNIIVGAANNTYTPSDMNMDDFRIYDHALSAKEVKNISRGLILHFPLTENGNNDNIEYDSSGYCNNSTERVSVITNSNTIKYNTSAYFDSNSYITLPPFNLDLSSITFSFWANWSDFKSWSRIFDFGTIYPVTSVQSNGILCANYGTKPQLVVHIYYGNSTILNTTNIMPITPNTWYHVVITTTKNVCNLYINGELYESFQLPKELGQAQLNYNYLGKSNWTADNLFKGNISDFRIYATVLSDEDVKELYEQSAFIDNKGNVGCYEFVET